jgi:acyl-CoA thioesterase
MTERTPETLKRRLFEFSKDFAFFKLIGFELLDVEPKWSKTRITFRPDLRNPNGVLHGGVIATLIDAGISQAMLMTDEYQRVRDTKGSMTSVDLRVKYLRPVSDGHVTCEARITHLGKRIGHASAVVTNAEGKEIALGDSIVMLTLGESGTSAQR